MVSKSKAVRALRQKLLDMAYAPSAKPQRYGRYRPIPESHPDQEWLDEQARQTREINEARQRGDLIGLIIGRTGRAGRMYVRGRLSRKGLIAADRLVVLYRGGPERSARYQSMLRRVCPEARAIVERCLIDNVSIETAAKELHLGVRTARELFDRGLRQLACADD